MGMPRHRALKALGEVISSNPLIPGSHVAMTYFPAPCSLPSGNPGPTRRENHVLGTFCT